MKERAFWFRSTEGNFLVYAVEGRITEIEGGWKPQWKGKLLSEIREQVIEEKIKVIEFLPE